MEEVGVIRGTIHTVKSMMKKAGPLKTTIDLADPDGLTGSTRGQPMSTELSETFLTDDSANLYGKILTKSREKITLASILIWSFHFPESGLSKIRD